jgi:hypothetical protein
MVDTGPSLALPMRHPVRHSPIGKPFGGRHISARLGGRMAVSKSFGGLQ